MMSLEVRMQYKEGVPSQFSKIQTPIRGLAEKGGLQTYCTGDSGYASIVVLSDSASSLEDFEPLAIEALRNLEILDSTQVEFLKRDEDGVTLLRKFIHQTEEAPWEKLAFKRVKVTYPSRLKYLSPLSEKHYLTAGHDVYSLFTSVPIEEFEKMVGKRGLSKLNSCYSKIIENGDKEWVTNWMLDTMEDDGDLEPPDRVLYLFAIIDQLNENGLLNVKDPKGLVDWEQLG